MPNIPDGAKAVPSRAWIVNGKLRVIVDLSSDTEDAHEVIKSQRASVIDGKGSTPLTFWPETKQKQDAQGVWRDVE